MQVIWCLKFCNMTKSGGRICISVPHSKFWGDLSPRPVLSPGIYAHARSRLKGRGPRPRPNLQFIHNIHQRLISRVFSSPHLSARRPDYHQQNVLVDIGVAKGCRCTPPGRELKNFGAYCKTRFFSRALYFANFASLTNSQK